MQESQLQAHLEAIAEDGFTILENVFSLERADAFRKRIREIERTTLRPLEPGETEEDSSFYRTAGLLRIDPIFWDVPIDPTVTQVVPFGDAPEGRPARSLVPVYRVLVADLGEPLVRRAVQEVIGVREVDVGERHAFILRSRGPPFYRGDGL